MTDRDPAARRPTSRPATPGGRTTPPAEPAPTGRTPARTPDGTPSGTPGTPDSTPDSTALRDRWWWSPTLSIVIGLVVVGYQLEPLRGSNPLWGNWAVAALGLVVAAYGAVRLLRAHRAR